MPLKLKRKLIGAVVMSAVAELVEVSKRNFLIL